MALACLVYIAKLSPKSDHVHLQQHKDLNTRVYARERITGVLVAAGGYLFEIMEGEYGLLESNLDRISSGALMQSPDILIFSALTKRQFHAWQMGVIGHAKPGSQDLSFFKVLGEQTQSNHASTPIAATQMLKRFHEQFATQRSDAA